MNPRQQSRLLAAEIKLSEAALAMLIAIQDKDQLAIERARKMIREAEAEFDALIAEIF